MWSYYVLREHKPQALEDLPGASDTSRPRVETPSNGDPAVTTAETNGDPAVTAAVETNGVNGDSVDSAVVTNGDSDNAAEQSNGNNSEDTTSESVPSQEVRARNMGQI